MERIMRLDRLPLGQYEHALCDGAQSIKPEVFSDIMEAVNMISETVEKIKEKHNGRVYTK